MNYWLRKFVLGVMLTVGLLGSAHAIYVGADPLNYIDPEGLSPRGLNRKPIDLIPLDGGGGFGGPALGGPSPYGGMRAPATARPGGQQTPLVAPQCPPEVQSTLTRIRAGQGFPHRNDGTVFQNREGLLPTKPDGYYREWVHPTPGTRGPGLQRVVTGQGGEVYYTPDHYTTFVPVP